MAGDTRSGMGPVVGRAAELAQVEGYLAAGGRAVILHGPVGVGKTRLARELLIRAERRGRTSRHALASPSASTIPFAAVVELLPPVELGGTNDATSLLRAGVRHVREEASRRPLTVCVDDAHLLDAGSLALLAALLGVDGLWLVLTVRAGQPVPEAITNLWKDDLALRLDLAALDRSDTAEFVAAQLGAPAEDSTVDRLWELSIGNPLVLRELLLAATDQGLLVHRGRRWRLTAAPAVSARLTDLVAARLSGLTADARRGMEALTLMEPLNYADLVALIGREATRDLEAAGAVEVVVTRRRHTVRFAHPIDGEVVRDSTPHSQRLHVAAALVDLLADQPSRRRGDRLRLAELWILTARPGRPALLHEAARQALGLADLERAERLAATALERGGGVEARLTHGEALTYLGLADQAEAVLASAVETAGTDAQRAQGALVRFHNHLFNRGDIDRAEAVLTAARSRVDKTDSRDELDAARSMAAMLRGDLQRAIAIGDDVRRREDGDPRTLLSVLVVSTLARTLLGDLDAARTELARAYPLIETLHDALPLVPDQIGITEVLALWHDARVSDAIDLASRRHLDVASEDAVERQGAWATTSAMVLTEGGRLEEAAILAEQAVGGLRGADPLGLRSTAVALRARCAAVLGRHELAERLLDELSDGSSSDIRTILHTARAHVWLAAALGEVERACALAVEHGRRAVATDHLVWGAMILHDVVRFGQPTDVLIDLADLAAAHDAELLQLYAEHARALCEADAAALLEVAERFRDGGLMLYAAEAMTQSADLHHRRGERRAHRSAVHAAITLATGCGPAATPALLHTEEPLTKRQRQVAIMACRGLSSQKVAEQLVLSVRTVDNHLAAVYRKTGASSRQELAAILGDQDPHATRPGVS